LSRLYFGEGIAILDDRLYQLTWQNGIGFVYDLESFTQVGTFRYQGEGWGLTHDGEYLIMSDGTATLRYLDPADFSVVRTLSVTDAGRPVVHLNELEFINGEIWSNIWYDDRIARISPATGEVTDWVDLGELYPPTIRPSDDVLNGIAWDADSGRLFVTGKNWLRVFELAPLP
jgi:glutaminyl-peptide cyclotransferase